MGSLKHWNESIASFTIMAPVKSLVGNPSLPSFVSLASLVGAGVAGVGILYYLYGYQKAGPVAALRRVCQQFALYHRENVSGKSPWQQDSTEGEGNICLW